MELARYRSPNVTTLVRICGNWLACRWVDGHLVIRRLAPPRAHLDAHPAQGAVNWRLGHAQADGDLKQGQAAGVQAGSLGPIESTLTATPGRHASERQDLADTLAGDAELGANVAEGLAGLVGGDDGSLTATVAMDPASA